MPYHEGGRGDASAWRYSMRGRIVALLLPVLLLAGLAVVPQPASASATGLTCVEYLVGAVICSAPPDGPLPYTRLDATAQATTPGSYAFLDATGHVVTTYEAMRDGSATRLRIHTSGADGTPHASLYGRRRRGRRGRVARRRRLLGALRGDVAAAGPTRHRAAQAPRGRVGGLRLHGLRGGRRSGSGRDGHTEARAELPLARHNDAGAPWRLPAHPRRLDGRC